MDISTIHTFLFKSTANKTYIIDLDIIMKGSILFVFGDMVRSITNGAKEDEKNLIKINSI